MTQDNLQQNPPEPAEIIKPLEDEPGYELDFWEDLKDSLPPWVDEVVGFTLVIFGILSFISLFVPSDAVVAVTWANILKTLFGSGSILVTATLFAIGILLWLPKTGLRIRISSAQMLAIEIAFLSILALLHLGNSDVELRALARAGQGGGLIGWGLSYPFYWMMGRSSALVFFAIVIAACLIAISGLQRRSLSAILNRWIHRLHSYSHDRHEARADAPGEDPLAIYKTIIKAAPRSPLMHIRFDPANLPEIVQTGRAEAAQIRAEARAAAEQGHTAPSAPSTPKPSPAETPASPASETAVPDRHALPAIELLNAVEMQMPSPEETEQNAEKIANTLREFDIDVHVADVQVGPTVTRYALQPHKQDGSDRIRLSKILSYTRDLSMVLAATRLRVEAPVPGTNYIGIEVPNAQAGTVALRNLLESRAYQNTTADATLPIPLGRDVAGHAVAIDLTAMPHLLIAGTTGSGKSVCIVAIATALLMQNNPDQLKLIMLDPKMVELSRFNGIPHLLGKVETDSERIMGVLRWCTGEMERRYALLERHSARNIHSYKAARQKQPQPAESLPYIVILIDEIGDLMLTNPEETETSITRLAQMARAVGMHMVIATQRPSTDVITGIIKANFPSRIAFSVASGIDSRVILDTVGAENLLGRGDMLYLSSNAAAARRVQGCFVHDDDLHAVVQHWQRAADTAAPPPSGPWEQSITRHQFLSDTDPMIEEVIKLVVREQEASASMIQRRLGLGFPRAARIMDLLEELGVLGEMIEGGRSRRVIIPKEQTDPFELVLAQHLQKKVK